MLPNDLFVFGFPVTETKSWVAATGISLTFQRKYKWNDSQQN